MIPYPPNFNKTAARIMEPSRGASTWAFGNHKCMKYIGSFTKNASIKNITILKFIIIINVIINVGLFFKIIILINRGSEAVIVYNRR